MRAQRRKGGLARSDENLDIKVQARADQRRQLAHGLVATLKRGRAERYEQMLGGVARRHVLGKLLELVEAVERLAGAVVEPLSYGGGLDAVVAADEQGRAYLVLELGDTLGDRLDGDELLLCR